ncbi:MAG: 2-phospho-L-lactate guanylyltransferase [Chloroflexota bacterium]|nr:2-phospho-L-lactate guanylyltransferase [Chloroflexota bacterium]
MSLWAIVPVKPLKNAKSRLSAVLSPEQRYELAGAMFRHVLSVLGTVPEVSGALVISRDTKALAIAREMGAKTIQESAISDLNPALMRATMILKSWRVDAVLILPADLPFVHADDIQALIELGRNRSIVIATDHNGDGTNALLARPPGLIQFDYGPGSYQRHIASAQGAGLEVMTYHSDRLASDIDVPADLERYRRMRSKGAFTHLPELSFACSGGMETLE